MMNNENYDFINKEIEDLINFSIDDISDNIIPQEELIDSNSKNSTGNSIYESLKDLYERLRRLEDLKNYTRYFLIKEVKNKTNEINSIIEELESISIEENLLTYEDEIPLINYGKSLEDKDGDILSPSFLKDGKIVLRYDNVYDSIIDNLIVHRNTMSPYKSTNIKNLQDDGVYRSMYITKDFQKEGVSETIVIKLDDGEIVNNIDIDTNNCSIEEITLIGNNNKNIYSKGNLKYIINNNNLINEIHVKINSKNFKQILYNKDKIEDDFFNSIRKGTERENILNQYDMYSKDSTYVIDKIIEEKGNDINFEDISGKPNIVKQDMVFEYIFGINSINIGYVEQLDKSFFISKTINIQNDVKEIELITEHSIGDGGIDIFFIKNNERIYIPNSRKQSKNEYFFESFNNKPLEDKILVNGMSSSIDDVKNTDIVTYNTNDNANIKVDNKDIVSIGAILRKGDIEDPFIKSIKIKKYRKA